MHAHASAAQKHAACAHTRIYTHARTHTHTCERALTHTHTRLSTKITHAHARVRTSVNFSRCPHHLSQCTHRAAVLRACVITDQSHVATSCYCPRCQNTSQMCRSARLRACVITDQSHVVSGGVHVATSCYCPLGDTSDTSGAETSKRRQLRDRNRHRWAD